MGGRKLLVVLAFFLVLAALIGPQGGIVHGKKKSKKRSKKRVARSSDNAAPSMKRGGSAGPVVPPPPPPPPPGAPPSSPPRRGADPRRGTNKFAVSGTAAGDADQMGALKVEPSIVNFGKRSACVPVVQTMTLTHDATYALDGDLKLYTVSSDNPQFHPAMFKQQSLSPGESTSFQIIFLPRAPGDVGASLTVKTSIGTHSIDVLGTGIDNPYGLTAFVGAKVPAGVHYNPPIRIYNPSNSVLRIKEVFTTEGFLHLSLPGNEPDGKNAATISHKAGAGAKAKGSAGMWNVQADATKEIIRLSFKSHISGRYQGYVHVKTSRENMVLPVQVTVLSGGIHTTPESLNFGIVTKPDAIVTRSIAMLNTGSDPVVIVGAFLSTVYHASVGRRTGKAKSTNWKKMNTDLIFQQNIPLEVGEEVPDVVSLSIKGKEEGIYSGNVIIMTNDTNPAQARVEVAYRVHVLHGGLVVQGGLNNFPVLGWKRHHDPSCLASRSALDRGTSGTICLDTGGRQLMRDMPLKNDFKTDILISKISVPDGDFEILNVNEFKDLILHPGEFSPAVQILYNSTSDGGELYTTFIRVDTNISALAVPLNVYHGQINVSWAVLADPSMDGDGTEFHVVGKTGTDEHVEERASVQMGTFAKNSSRFAVVRLTNYNPVPILVSEIFAANGAIDLSYLGSYRVLPISKIRGPRPGYEEMMDLDADAGPEEEYEVDDMDWVPEDPESLSAAAIRTACHAWQCTAAEFHKVKDTKQKRPWNEAVDGLSLDRCVQSRGEWAWTCETPASLNMSADIGRRLSDAEVAHLVGSLARRQEFEAFDTENYTYFDGFHFGRTARHDVHGEPSDRVLQQLESALFIVRLRPSHLPPNYKEGSSKGGPSVLIESSLHQKVRLEFNYATSEGSLYLQPSDYHFKSSGGKLALYASSSLSAEVSPTLSISDTTGHFRIVPRAKMEKLTPGESSHLLAYVDYNPLQGCHNYMYDEKEEAEWLGGGASQPAYTRVDGWRPGYGSPWCSLLPPVTSLLDQFIDEGPVEEFEYGLWFVWRSKILNYVDSSFWSSLQAEAYISVSTTYGYSNSVKVVGDAPKINLIDHEYLNFGAVGLSQAASKYVRIFNPTSQTVEAELVGGIPVGSSCADMIQSEFDDFASVNGTDWLRAATRAVGIKCKPVDLSDEGFVQRVRYTEDREEEQATSAFVLESETRTIKLDPNTEAFLGPITFRPTLSGDYKSTIYIRSLLGGVEAVNLAGSGSTGRIAFIPARDLENDISQYTSCRPMTANELSEEDKETAEKRGKHFAECHESIEPGSNVIREYQKDEFVSQKGSIASVPMNLRYHYDRSATTENASQSSITAFEEEVYVVNVGSVPLLVSGFGIGNDGCRGNGFSLVGCEKMQEQQLLNPLEFHRLQFRFQTDCASSVADTRLYALARLAGKHEGTGKSNSAFLEIPLSTSVDNTMLPACSKAYMQYQFGSPWVVMNFATVALVMYVAFILMSEFYRYKKVAQPLVVVPKVVIKEAEIEPLPTQSNPTVPIPTTPRLTPMKDTGGAAMPSPMSEATPAVEVPEKALVNPVKPADVPAFKVARKTPILPKPSEVVPQVENTEVREKELVPEVSTNVATVEKPLTKTVAKTVEDDQSEKQKEREKKAQLDQERKAAEKERKAAEKERKAAEKERKAAEKEKKIAEKKALEKNVEAAKKQSQREKKRDKANRELLEMKKELEFHREEAKRLREKNEKAESELRARAKSDEKVERIVSKPPRPVGGRNTKKPVRPPPGFDSAPQFDNTSVSCPSTIGGSRGSTPPAGFGNDIHNGNNTFIGGLNLDSNAVAYHNANETFGMDVIQKPRSRSGSGNHGIIGNGMSPQISGMPAPNDVFGMSSAPLNLNPANSGLNTIASQGTGSYSAFGNSSWGGSSNTNGSGMFGFLPSVDSSNAGSAASFNNSFTMDGQLPSRQTRLGSLNADVVQSSTTNTKSMDDDDDEEILLMAGNAFGGGLGGFGNFGEASGGEKERPGNGW